MTDERPAANLSRNDPGPPLSPKCLTPPEDRDGVTSVTVEASASTHSQTVQGGPLASTRAQGRRALKRRNSSSARTSVSSESLFAYSSALRRSAAAGV